MKRLCITIIAALSFGVLAFAAGIDGTWTGKVPLKGKKADQAKEITATLNLKAEGNKLTGTMSMGRGGRKSTEIKDGTIDGNQISFSTTAKTKKKGDVTTQWEGTLAGDELKITSEGRKKRSPVIVLKRQG